MSDVYCSKKFKDLQVHVQSRLLYNCGKAWPERIDINWLEKNPGKLFHTPTMIADRQAMLEGKRTRACEHGCYCYEDQGLISARDKVNKEKIIDIYNPLESLGISLSTDCNLTCTYCSSEWSTAWNKDIKTNGEYGIEGYKNKNDNWSKLWNNIKQKDRSVESKFFNLLLKEITMAKGLKQIIIVGGEPLINNQLIKVLDVLKDKKIKIVSGLGINFNKFKKIIDKIKDKQNLSFEISAESNGSIFEFLRYGTNWNDFLNKIDYLKKNNLMITFISTITNLSTFGIVPFYKFFKEDHKIIYNPVLDRTFLQPNVLDDLSKKNLIDSIKDEMDNKFFLQLKQSISQEYSDNERKKLSVFLKEFARRRNLKLDIFPVHFLKWLDLN